MPAISVIVPVYKVEAYLEPCVSSILNQTFRDLEIILVDDGSPDHCGQLCEDLAARDARIRVIHQKNKGLSGARNTGLRAARGEYVCFIDSDDLICPDYCEALYQALQGTDCDFSVCAAHRFEDGQIPAPRKAAGPEGVVSNVDFLRMQFEHRSEFGVWNKLFPRERLLNLQFMEGKLHEDVIFSADLVKQFHKGVACVGDELHLYRQRGGSIMSSHAKRCSPDLIFAGEYLLSAVKENCPELTGFALQYAIKYPWSFVDPVYVERSFRQDWRLLDAIQQYLKRHIREYDRLLPEIVLHRMKLFSRSRFLYGFNAYARLAWVYCCRLTGWDAYQSGHGI